MQHRVRVFLAVASTGVGYASAAVALAQCFQSHADTRLFLPQVSGRLPEGLQAHVPFAVRLPGRIGARPAAARLALRRSEAAFLRDLRRSGPGTVAWMWPDAPLDLLRAAKETGAVMVREMINCHRVTARRIVDGEAARLGLPPQSGITDAKVAGEIAELALFDHIVSPSEGVDASLVENGIAPERIIRTTFGWDPAQFSHGRAAALPGAGPHALFVGHVGARKGVLLALDAWERAKTGGTFVIVGAVDAAMEPLLAPWRARADIVFMAYDRDLESLYRAADFMLFPTLEEGAPLVCYQAAGCGLPILTGPMGAGRIVEDGVSGRIVHPHDADGVEAAIRALAGDAGFRTRLASEAKRRADAVTWPNAAAGRMAAIGERLGWA